MRVRKEKHDAFLGAVVAYSVLAVFILQSQYGFVALLFSLAAYFMVVRHGTFSKNEIFLVLLFSVAIFPSLFFLQHGASHYFYYFLTLICFLSASAFSRLGAYSIFIVMRMLFFSYVLFAFLVYYLYRDLAEPFSRLVEGSSTNGIPSYLIVVQVLYSLVYYTVHKRLPALSSLLTLIVALLGIGRGSIYVSLMIVVASIFINLIIDVISGKYFSIIVLLSALVVGFGFILLNLDVLFAFLEVRTKALHGIVDPYRNRIMIEYISSVKWWQVFVGGEFKDTVISSLYDNNPHIAFIRSHAYMGIFYTIFVLLSPLIFLLKTRSYLDSVVFFVFSLFLLLRAFSEPILFPTALDFFYYLIFCFYFRHVFIARNFEGNEVK